MPTGFGCDSFNARRSQTEIRLSSEPLTINELELSIKRTALTSSSWAWTYDILNNIF
jgi:hypothetical protein